MTILYINEEHCSSLEQLKDFFGRSLTPGDDIYEDLLDYGKYGDIAVWLRERDEPELASRVESIPGNLSDSSFYAQLKTAITGLDVTDAESLKPSFERCFSYQRGHFEVKDNEASVSVTLKVLMCVNEEYELTVSGNWGTRAETVNPYNFTVGQTIKIDFRFRKRPGREIDELKVKADGKELASMDAQFCGDVDEIHVGNVRFKMIRVEGGTFTMGATPEMKNPQGNERHKHQVTLNSYYIGETPVTQALWKAVMGNNPSHFQGDNRPAEFVSWYDCQKFILKLNAKTGRSFRLPTEAEWEFAARGGNRSNHTQYSGSSTLKDVAWYDGNSGGTTHPVKTKKPNELGIYDMSGNVCEWCQDWYGYYSGNVETNPTGIESGSHRVARGGCWSFIADNCRSSRRYDIHPDSTYNYLGFRIALSE